MRATCSILLINLTMMNTGCEVQYYAIFSTIRLSPF